MNKQKLNTYKNENIEDYKIRLFKNKDELTWNEIKNMISDNYSNYIPSDNIRKEYYFWKRRYELEGNKERNNTRILTISDCHVPFHLSVDEYIEFKECVDILVLNGDIMDCHSLSKFTKLYRKPLIEEMVVARDFIIELIEMIKPKKVIVNYGNHESRLSYKVANDLGVDIMELMPKSTLEFVISTGFTHYNHDENTNIFYKPVKDCVECEVEYTNNFWCVVGKTIFAHPQAFVQNVLGTTVKAYDYFNAKGVDFDTVVLAHTHFLSFTMYGEKYLFEQGCMANLSKMNYMDTKLPKRPQNNGVVYIVQNENGNIIFDKSKIIKK